MLRMREEYSTSSGSWQLEHPQLAMALWCALILAVCVPLKLRRFNRTLAA